ncbi:MAG: hypothetical protein AAGE65_01430 [Planctomycetota bacterium]
MPRSALPPAVLAITTLLAPWFGNAAAEPALAEPPGIAPTFSFKLAEAAVQRVGPLDARALLDDELFLDTLRGVLRDDTLDPTEQVDAFYLLHRKIGLHFSGFAALPPGMSYADVFWGKADVMNAYREALADLNLSGKPFEVVARESYRGGHSVRLGSAVLLAALVDPPEGRKLLDILGTNRLQRASVPPIAAHYVAWSACVAGHAKHAEALAGLAAVVPLEEVREDFVLAVGYRDPGPELLGTLESFAMRSAQAGFDQAIGATLTVLHRHLHADAYRGAWRRVRDASPDAAWTRAVDAFRDGPPPRGAMSEPPPESGSDGWVYKLWDGFEVTSGEESDTLRWGDAFYDTTQP